jgi:hypothetical protein
VPVPLPTHTNENLLSLMYQAVASPLGIIVVVSDVIEAKVRLGQVRKENGDSALRALSFIPSPYSPRTELWIVKKRLAVKPQEDDLLDTSLPIDITP